MSKLVIDLSKWSQRGKYILGIVCFLFLMFAGYKMFVSKEWEMDGDTQRKLIETEQEVKRLKDSIQVIRSYNDSIGRVNDEKYARYKSWKRDSDNYKELKRRFDEMRDDNSSLSADEHVKLLSEWLNQ